MAINKPILNQNFIFLPQNRKGHFLKSLPHLHYNALEMDTYGQCSIFLELRLMVDVDVQGTSKITMIRRVGHR